MISQPLCTLFFYLLCYESYTSVSSQKTFLDNPLNLQLYRTIRRGIYDIFGRTSISERALRRAKNLYKIQEPIPQNVSFPCDVKGWRSSETPTSVHRLKPGDIDIIASMGDSLSAGTGIFAESFLHLFIDNRGVSAAGGGQNTWREYMTLPNILKEFNPNLYGYSSGDYSTLEKGSKFNVAEAGAVSSDMPYMATILIKRMKNDPKVNMQKHWKHISLMIGSNDFCLFFCTKPSLPEILQNHERDIVETLRILRDNIPRVFVSLIPPPQLKVLVKNLIEGEPSIWCDILTDLECPCLFGLRYRDKIQEYYDAIKRWQDIDIKISNYSEFQKDDFVVVAQPILTNLDIFINNNYFDETYLTIDCFHISQKANSLYANALWNSLLLPYEEKPTTIEQNLFTILCPTKKRPYLVTYANTKFSENSE
ncbi:phospholipase B1, membrane-associated-like [Vespula pensylvanica]|uniref:phospholipase B1, membrane-associated-like n=1 Tax=Vespula pensylvanica TaxID=30213 RepID=UPI001CB9DA18|nr:phospholipase B1, membrane-associated-like [Vespula pensylvanica]